jgi:predicted pyridoxine 5'-phosphate oxidase superfamily flavin-nucleotide-binding protein
MIRAEVLDDVSTALISQADTFFIASNDPSPRHGLRGGPDVSHRGGRPGFVRLDDERTLTAPEFAGNSMFNTLGNIMMDPRVGLLFIDFDRGDFLQISAEAEVVWEGAELQAFAGAQRLVRFHIAEISRIEAALPAQFSSPDYSPLLSRTGIWAETETRP